MKKILIVLVLIAAVATLIYLFRSEKATDNSLVGNDDSNGDSIARGTIVEVDTTQVPVDGPTRITVRQENGSQVFVAIPSMGINLCPAQENIADWSILKTGDRIEVRGSELEGSILPCESSAHYLKVID